MTGLHVSQQAGNLYLIGLFWQRHASSSLAIPVERAVLTEEATSR
jgi:hypothetical protein